MKLNQPIVIGGIVGIGSILLIILYKSISGGNTDKTYKNKIVDNTWKIEDSDGNITKAPVFGGSKKIKRKTKKKQYLKNKTVNKK